jgi:hypothetical protein
MHENICVVLDADFDAAVSASSYFAPTVDL